MSTINTTRSSSAPLRAECSNVSSNNMPFDLVHSTGQDLLPRRKGHNRTSRSLTRCPSSPTPHSHTKDNPAPESPYSYRIARGFFNVPQNYQHSRNCERGPPAYHPYPRRLESHFVDEITKAALFSSVI